MKLIVNFIFLLVVVLLLTAVTVSAEVPQLINYQGRLTDPSGEPVEDGPYLIKFKIYGSAAGNDSLWWSGFQAIQVESGLFSHQLGSIAPLPDDLFATDTIRYLGITIGVDNEITPRARLTSLSYAYHALRTDTAGYALDISDGSVTTSKLANDAVTAAKIADNAVTTAKIQDYSIVTSDIAYDAVTSDKIQDATIMFEDVNRNGADAGQVMKWDGTQWLASNDDAGGTGDITAVYAGSGLTGGATSGDATLSVDTDGIGSEHIAANAVDASEIAADAVGSSEIATGAVYSPEIADNTIVDADIYSSADISPSKIEGTAVNLTSTQEITGEKIFTQVLFGDSTMRVNPVGIRIGDPDYPSYQSLVITERDYNITSPRYAYTVKVKNSATGDLYGFYADVEHTTAGSGGTAMGVFSYTTSDGDGRYGVYGTAKAKNSAISTGTSYGIRGRAYDGEYAYGMYAEGTSATNNYGIYASCGVSNGNYGGYFYGNLHSTGSNTKGIGGFMIDHPLDPENRYLTHSDVESPEMKNVYDGVVELDANGEATVELPDYFEALNGDFRYQLTCIGAYAPVYVSEKISGNRFSIAGGMPYLEVSWQVTGIRKDAFAGGNRIPVEIEKSSEEKGLYMHPTAFGFGEEKQIHHERNKAALEEPERSE